MPEEATWESLFDPGQTLERLGFSDHVNVVVEFGCSDGTFTIPAVRRCRGLVRTFDSEPEMIARTRAQTEAAGLANVKAELRNLISQGTGLADAVANFAMRFNILHANSPLQLHCETWWVLKPGGLLGVMR